HGVEENEFAAQQLRLGSVLLFGRVTYELMASYWPTPQAIQQDPPLAQAMNDAEKIVFSRTLRSADWNNTRLYKDNVAQEMRKLKQTPGKDMTLLGSGSVVVQFADEGLIDEYQIMVDPVLLGSGTPLCSGIQRRHDLRLTMTKAFGSGCVLLTYEAG
ncbi:MAG TPA: dihydrofolate reductase family protein, partial [Burkholderiaceae bacterium]|nr:dihydrofolate reductase family protein [Burkholderiaceae bacterium]